MFGGVLMAIRPDNYPDDVMAEIRIIESRCRDGLNRAGEVFLFDGHCPPICPELMAPMNHLLYAIKEGMKRIDGDDTVTVKCPDSARVVAEITIFDD